MLSLFVMSVEAKAIFDGGVAGSINKNGGEITSSKDYTIEKDNFSARDAIISVTGYSVISNESRNSVASSSERESSGPPTLNR